MQSTRSAFFVFLVALLFVAPPVAAEPQRPVKLSEIRKMIDADQTPEQVLAALAERGAGFRFNGTAERQLSKWGFTPRQLDLVGRIVSGEQVDLAPKPDPAPEGATEGEAEAGPADAAGGPEAEVGVGYAMPAGWHASEKKRVVRAAKASHGYKRIELTRCTLYCSERRAKQLVPMLRKLEAELIAAYPASLRNACSPDSAHIVIVDGDSQWASWVEAFFDSYEQDGLRFSFGPGVDAREQVIKGGASFMPTVAMRNASSARSEEQISRFAAYALGHLMMQQAAGPKQPHGLRTGFANVAEALAHGTPSVTVVSYTERKVGPLAWKQNVLERFQARKIKTVTRVWTHDTAEMQAEDYAECWSYVSMLCQAPDKFAAVVDQVRQGGGPVAGLITDAYGLEDKKLLEAWYKHTGRQP